MRNDTLRQLLLAVVLLLTAGSPAHIEAAGPSAAAVRPVSDAVVLADAWSFGPIFTSGGRTRIVQICAAAMCLALFIMMKKLNG